MLNPSRLSPGVPRGCTRVPHVPPTLTPRLPFSEDVLDIRLPLIRILDSGGVAVGGAPGTRGTRV